MTDTYTDFQKGTIKTISGNDVGFFYPKTQERRKSSKILSHNTGMYTRKDFESTLSAVVKKQPKSFLFQENKFDRKSISHFQELGYSLWEFPYIFGEIHSSLVIGYSGKITDPMGKLMIHPESSFPRVRNLLKRFGIPDIVAIMPMINVGGKVLATFHNSSFISPRKRDNFMEEVLKILKPLSFVCAGDPNTYGDIVDTEVKRLYNYIIRQMNIAGPYYSEAFRAYGFEAPEICRSNSNIIEAEGVKASAEEKSLCYNYFDTYLFDFKKLAPSWLRWIFWILPNYKLSLYLDCIISSDFIGDVKKISTCKDHDILIF